MNWFVEQLMWFPDWVWGASVFIVLVGVIAYACGHESEEVDDNE